MGTRGSEEIPFNTENSPVYEFVKGFAKSAVSNLKELDGKSKRSKKYDDLIASVVGTSVGASEVTRPLKHLTRTLVKAALAEYDKVEQEGKKITVQSTIDAKSSQDFPQEFLQHFIKLGICVYKIYEPYFKYINFEAKSTSNENKLLAIGMLGEYAGAKCFSHMHEHGSKNEMELSKSLSNISYKGWVSSWWNSNMGALNFYFLVQVENGEPNSVTQLTEGIRKFFIKGGSEATEAVSNPPPKQKSITPEKFFSEKVFTSPKYAWNFNKRDDESGNQNPSSSTATTEEKQSKEKKYRLLSTIRKEESNTLNFLIDWKEADLNRFVDFVYNTIRYDWDFDKDLATQETLKAIKVTGDKSQATGEETHEMVAKLLSRDKANYSFPVDPQPKIERFRVEDPIRPFIGRKAFLEKLVQAVKEGQGQGERGIEDPPQENITVVTATGGVGKTETVRRYIQKHGHEYDHIVWIDAEDIESAQSQFIQLALRLNISPDFDGKPKEFDQILFEIFETKLLPDARVVLLVLDNAETLDDDPERKLKGIRPLLPKSLSGFCVEPTVIVTSRTQNWSVERVIPLDLWSHEEVVLFVNRQLPLQTDEKALQQLETRFGFLPVAIKSAVAVILQQNKWGDTKYGILNLLKEYNDTESERRKKVLEQKHLKASVGPEQTTLTMLVLWNISLEKIVKFKYGEFAVKILCCMAYMSPTRISQDFLFAIFKNCSTKDSFSYALEILEDYSLIASQSTSDSDSRSFSIHRMIQDSTIENLRTRTTNEGQTRHVIFKDETFLNETEVLLKLSTRSVVYLNTLTKSTLARSGELVETLIQITNHVCDKLDVEKFRDFTEVTANVLQKTNNFSKSIELFKRALEATPCCNENLGKRTQLKWALGSAYVDGGHLQESSELFLQVYDAMESIIFSDHSKMRDANSTACALYIMGNLADALHHFERFLIGYENNIAFQNKDLLDTKRSVDFFFPGQSCTVELLEQVLNEREKNPDYNPYNIILEKMNIARELTNEGKLDEASKVRLQITEDAAELLGPYNQFTLQFERDYASGLHDQEKDDEAAPLLLELLYFHELLFDPDHRYTLDTKLVLAAVYLATKKLDKAEALLDLQIWERVFGLNDPKTMKAANILSNVKMEQGKFGDTLALCEKVLKIQTNVLVPNHEATLRTMHNISALNSEMGEYEMATKVAQELLKRQRETLGKNHPDAVRTLQVLAQTMDRPKFRDDLISCFMARTSADAETGKSLLQASNWNFKAALDTYWNSNPNAPIVDQDVASTFFYKLPQRKLTVSCLVLVVVAVVILCCTVIKHFKRMHI